MKIRMLITISIIVLTVLAITGSCATTSKTQEEREVVNHEVFLESVGTGDFTEVKRLIESGADVNLKDEEGYTMLMEAAWSGYTEIAELL